MSIVQIESVKIQQEAFLNGPKTPTMTEPTKLFEQLNMPSPPMSPYARSIDGMEARLPDLVVSRANKSIESEIRNSHSLSGPSVKHTSFKQITQQRESTPIEIPECAADSPQQTVVPHRFPLEDLTKSKLLINGFSRANRPGFKRSQLAFLGSYHLKEFKNVSDASLRSSHRGESLRKVQRSTKYTHSDNDSATEEKPRTRRTVRANKFDLESDVESNGNVSPAPSTPKRRLPPAVAAQAVQASPKRSRPSTPVPYAYDYNQIQDFSPPLSTLPNSNKCLKADWKGQSMDLTGDPLYNKLHPAEIVLAATLRLPCNVYLDSKRRIFHEKVKRMRMDLPFRRTDAQKSCKIDVNKASRLFASFEKVGWLQDSHFEKYM